MTVIWAKDPFMSVLILLLYGSLNIAYSLKLKTLPVIDVTVLAVGFLLRVLYGGYYFDIAVSSWLCLCILALAYFFALGKRRGEFQLLGSKVRSSLEKCTVAFFDKSMYAFMALGLVFYSLWLSERMACLNSILHPLLFSSCIVIAFIACLRYSLLIESGMSDGDPIEVVFSDRTLLVSILIWVILMVILVYLIL